MNLLEIKELKVSYGGIDAVKGVNLQVKQGELIALIGANGAGKTTTLKAITGTLSGANVQGEMLYQGTAGVAIQTLKANQLVRHGLAMVPEGRGVFARMTVLENLLMGAYVSDNKAEIAADIERWFAIFPRLKERTAQLAGTLSGGEQQMLVMARALMSRPQVLLLDEPSMGLAPLMVEAIFDVIRKVSIQGVSILLVEQNAKLALQTSHRAYVMESGVIVLDGAANALLNDPAVQAAYLGE